MRRHAQDWEEQRGSVAAEAYILLSFAPGEAYQFDWSHEIVLLDGVTVTLKVAHMRLCHRRMFFVRAYPREMQEMVFDAHDRAAFFRGACTRGIYDNMKTAVDAIFIGRDRRYNRRVAQMCGHYLVETETRAGRQGRTADHLTRLDFVVPDELGYPCLPTRTCEKCPESELSRRISTTQTRITGQRTTSPPTTARKSKEHFIMSIVR